MSKSKWTKKKLGDAVMEDARNSDLVIPLMGPTGVGKSTFINSYFGKKRAEVGNTIASCTRNLAWYTTTLPDGPFTGRRLILVDTPGFDDTYADDSEILRRVAVWLAASYDNDMSVAGVLYLHDIGQKQMVKSNHLKPLENLADLHCKGLAPPIALVTTQWDTVQEELGGQRERELKQSFWKDAINKGAEVYRVRRDSTHAGIIDNILAKSQTTKNSITTRLIPHEFVTMERSIPLAGSGEKVRFGSDNLLNDQAEIAKNAEDDAIRREADKRSAAIRECSEGPCLLEEYDIKLDTRTTRTGCQALDLWHSPYRPFIYWFEHLGVT
ncbi:P-loop containing nucleoside triphosphate hydrolase protein [Coprinopsis sp. MPI-PUGE-AT-0042]|nr:P-loop containing nucleoside triphosphate hydrolase protein [Coprinopsis sp. MPI-PUGE-AT-0042]